MRRRSRWTHWAVAAVASVTAHCTGSQVLERVEAFAPADPQAGADAGAAVASCDPTVPGECPCSALPVDSPCEGDGDLCTVERCDGAGTCAFAGNLEVDDQNPCTLDACQAGEAVHLAAIDGSPCLTGQGCPLVGICGAGTCSFAPCRCETAAECEATNQDKCLGEMDCAEGVCSLVAGTAVTCPAEAPPCWTNLCEPATGTCAAAPHPSGTACEDGDPCTVGDGCYDGACAAGSDCAELGQVCAGTECVAVTGVVSRTLALAGPVTGPGGETWELVGGAPLGGALGDLASALILTVTSFAEWLEP